MKAIVLRGELYWAALDPTIGCEIAKTRPAIVASADWRNRAKHTTVIVIPVSSYRRGRRLRRGEIHVPAGDGLARAGVGQLHQIRAIDRSRLRARIGRVRLNVLAAIEEGLKEQLALV
jgi:mRNA-degrading endonuclease toxin of MazEF toxin-antitoxin module